MPARTLTDKNASVHCRTVREVSVSFVPSDEVIPHYGARDKLRVANRVFKTLNFQSIFVHKLKIWKRF